MSDPEKIQYDLDKAAAEKVGEVEARLDKARLNKEERRKLYKTVRYSYMSHKELVKLSADQAFEEARDLVLEGLSLRLKTYENVDGEEEVPLTINLNPRTNYELPVDPVEE